jgi:hypothetical protein
MNQLPKEILTHIFKHFQTGLIEPVQFVSLKMVCKYFYDIIVQLCSHFIFPYTYDNNVHTLIYYCDNMLYTKSEKIKKYDTKLNTFIDIHKSKISN